MKLGKKRTYQYIITLDKQFWPRKLADYLEYESGSIGPHLKSVTDVQNDTHIYGRTYRVGVPIARQAVRAKDKQLFKNLGLA